MRIENAYQFIEKGYCENFTLDEWSDPKELKLVDYRVIEALDDLREKFGHPIYPSRAEGGLIRRTGSTTSRHFVGDGKLGQAIDVFPSVNTLDCWLHAIEDIRWYGIGVYLDTNILPLQPGAMLHLDIDNTRTERAFWVRDGEYYLKSSKPEKFWKKLGQAYRL